MEVAASAAVPAGAFLYQALENPNLSLSIQISVYTPVARAAYRSETRVEPARTSLPVFKLQGFQLSTLPKKQFKYWAFLHCITFFCWSILAGNSTWFRHGAQPPLPGYIRLIIYSTLNGYLL